jgi:hypothetical protein
MSFKDSLEVVSRFKPGKGNVGDQMMSHMMMLSDVMRWLKKGVTTHAAAVTFAVDDDPDMLSFDGDIHVKLGFYFMPVEFCVIAMGTSRGTITTTILGFIACPTLSRVKLWYTFHVLLLIATFLKAAGHGDSTIFCSVEETPQFIRSSY